jgi:membrane protease YdiL (CAAX protease family)
MDTTYNYPESENRETIRKSLLELLMMKNKLIFVSAFLISVVIVRIMMIRFFIDISPIVVAIAFILILRDKFSDLRLRLFNPLSLIVILLITYVLLFLTISIQSYFNFSEFSFTSDKGTITGYFLSAIIMCGFAEETAWRGYLFSKLKDLTWFQITIIINLIWAIWHIPSHFFVLEGHIWISFPLFIVSCFELGIIMQYLRVKTDSVIPCILFHALFIFPLMLSGLKTNVLYLGSFPYIILLLLLLPLTIYCYKAGQRIHEQQNNRAPEPAGV